MKYTILIFRALYIAFKEMMKNGGKLNHESQKKYIKKVYKYGKKHLGWSYEYFTHNNLTSIIEPVNLLKQPDNILFIGNHANFMDVFIIPYILTNQFPEHHITFITKDKYKSMPFIGPYLASHHILVKNKLEEDLALIKYKINLIKKKHKKTLVVLFPEGTFMEPYCKEKSDKWCDKLDIPWYKNVLAPRTNGIYTVLKTYQPNAIIQGLVAYDNNPLLLKGVYYHDFLTGNFPTKAKFYLNLVETDFKSVMKNKELFNKQFYKYWHKNVDKLLDKII